MTSLTIDVLGTPAPQGSKKGFFNPKLGRVQVVEDNAPKTKTWRQDVLTAAVDAQPEGWEPIDAAVWIEAVFYFRRPASHFGTGRNAGTLKDSAPERPAVKPDIDKVLRATLDGLATAGCYVNDSRVVSVTVEKRYVDELHRLEGAVIEVYALDQESGSASLGGRGSLGHLGPGGAVVKPIVPCKRPKVTSEPAHNVQGLYNHRCLVPGCEWRFTSVKTAQEIGWHKRAHRDAVPVVDLYRGDRGFFAHCRACDYEPYDGVETSRQSVEQSMAYHLSHEHGLVSC